MADVSESEDLFPMEDPELDNKETDPDWEPASANKKRKGAPKSTVPKIKRRRKPSQRTQELQRRTRVVRCLQHHGWKQPLQRRAEEIMTEHRNMDAQKWLNKIGHMGRLFVASLIKSDPFLQKVFRTGNAMQLKRLTAPSIMGFRDLFMERFLSFYLVEAEKRQKKFAKSMQLYIVLAESILNGYPFRTRFVCCDHSLEVFLWLRLRSCPSMRCFVFAFDLSMMEREKRKFICTDPNPKFLCSHLKILVNKFSSFTVRIHHAKVNSPPNLVLKFPEGWIDPPNFVLKFLAGWPKCVKSVFKTSLENYVWWGQDRRLGELLVELRSLKENREACKLFRFAEVTPESPASMLWNPAYMGDANLGDEICSYVLGDPWFGC